MNKYKKSLNTALVTSSFMLSLLTTPEISNATMGGGKKPPVPPSKPPSFSGSKKSPSLTSNHSSLSSLKTQEIIVIDSDDEDVNPIASTSSTSFSSNLKRSFSGNPSNLPFKKRFLIEHPPSKNEISTQKITLTTSSDTKLSVNEGASTSGMSQSKGVKRKKPGATTETFSPKFKTGRSVVKSLKDNYIPRGADRDILINPDKTKEAPMFLANLSKYKTSYKKTVLKNGSTIVERFLTPINKHIDKVKNPEKYYATSPKTRKPLAISPLADPITNVKNNSNNLMSNLMDTKPN